MKEHVFDDIRPPLTGSTKIDPGKSQNFFLMVVLLPFTFLSFRRSALSTFKQSIPGSLWAHFQMAIRSTKTQAVISIFEESKELWDCETRNPVLESSEFAYKVGQLLSKVNVYV